MFIILSYHFDEIGIGENADRPDHIEDYGNAGVRQLCEDAANGGSEPSDPIYVCSNPNLAVSYSDVLARLDVTGGSVDVIHYPATDQTGVKPIFYDEFPDPLPNNRFSGMPISVQFNTYVHNGCVDIYNNFQSFKLYNMSDSGAEENVLMVMKKDNDPNGHFTECEYALFPKKRLDFGHTYKAVFSANGNTQEWKFTVEKPNGTILTVNQQNQSFTVKNDVDYYIYIPPTEDNLMSVWGYQWSSVGNVQVDMDIYDSNTLHVRLTGGTSGDKVDIDFNNKKNSVHLNI